MYVKVLPLEVDTTPLLLGYDISAVGGFMLEMKRKPAKYAFLYFLPSGHNCSFIKEKQFRYFGIKSIIVTNAGSFRFCVRNKFLDSSIRLSCALWPSLDNSAGEMLKIQII